MIMQIWSEDVIFTSKLVLFTLMFRGTGNGMQPCHPVLTRQAISTKYMNLEGHVLSKFPKSKRYTVLKK